MRRQRAGEAQACIFIDFINPLDFKDGTRLRTQAIKAAGHAAELKRHLKTQRTPLIYANDNFGNWRSDFRQLIESCTSSPGHGLVELLTPQPEDLFVFKPRHSCFYQTPLMLLLQNLQVRRLILTGLTTDICVLFSAYDAYMRGFELWIPANCTAAVNTADKNAALRYMARVLKADITPTKKFSHNA